MLCYLEHNRILQITRGILFDGLAGVLGFFCLGDVLVVFLDMLFNVLVIIAAMRRGKIV